MIPKDMAQGEHQDCFSLTRWSHKVSTRKFLLLLALTILLASPLFVEKVLSQPEGALPLPRLGNSIHADAEWWQDLNVYSTGGNTTVELDRLVNVIGLGAYLETESS